IIFDTAGQPVASSARLSGAIPIPPNGVFANVRQAGEERLTWEPQPGVRSATVITRVDGPTPGFVLAGRSLREVEQREGQTELFAAGAWLAGLLASAVLCGVQVWARHRSRPALEAARDVPGIPPGLQPGDRSTLP